MRRSILSAAFLSFVVAGCGGGGNARVKGQIVENGQPKAVTGQASVEFRLVGDDGKPDAKKSYSAMLNPDGKFELVASGGELPPGNYAVSISAVGKANAQFKGFNVEESKVRRELKPGPNEIQIDLARPEG